MTAFQVSVRQKRKSRRKRRDINLSSDDPGPPPAHHAQCTEARQKTKHRHTKEQRDAQERLDTGRRDHLDNDW